MGNPVLLLGGVAMAAVFVWMLAKSPVVGIYLLGLLIPFQIYLGSSPGREGITMAFLLSQATFVLLFLRKTAERKLSVKACPFALPVAAFVLAKFISTANSSDLSVSWEEIKTLIAFLSIFTTVFYALRDERQMRHAVVALLISGAASCALGIKQSLSSPDSITQMMASPIGRALNGNWIREMTDPGGWYSGPAWVLGRHFVRVVGPFFNPDYYAAYLGVLIALCLGLAVFAERTLHKMLLWPLFLVLLANLFMTQSRGGYITLVICVGVMAIAAVRMGKSPRWLLAVPATVLSFGTIAVLETTRSSAFANIAARGYDPMDDSRWIIWSIFWSKIGAHPILGHGLNRIFPIPECPWMSATHAHNLYLQLLFATGIVGLGAFVWVLIMWLKGCIRACKGAADNTSRGLALGLLGACVWLILHSAVDYNFLQIKNGMLWWYVLGISAALLFRLETVNREARGVIQS